MALFDDEGKRGDNRTSDVQTAESIFVLTELGAKVGWALEEPESTIGDYARYENNRKGRLERPFRDSLPPDRERANYSAHPTGNLDEAAEYEVGADDGRGGRGWRAFMKRLYGVEATGGDNAAGEFKPVREVWMVYDGTSPVIPLGTLPDAFRQEFAQALYEENEYVRDYEQLLGEFPYHYRFRLFVFPRLRSHRHQPCRVPAREWTMAVGGASVGAGKRGVGGKAEPEWRPLFTASETYSARPDPIRLPKPDALPFVAITATAKQSGVAFLRAAHSLDFDLDDEAMLDYFFAILHRSYAPLLAVLHLKANAYPWPLRGERATAKIIVYGRNERESAARAHNLTRVMVRNGIIGGRGGKVRIRPFRFRSHSFLRRRDSYLAILPGDYIRPLYALRIPSHTSSRVLYSTDSETDEQWRQYDEGYAVEGEHTAREDYAASETNKADKGREDSSVRLPLARLPRVAVQETECRRRMRYIILGSDDLHRPVALPLGGLCGEEEERERWTEAMPQVPYGLFLGTGSADADRFALLTAFRYLAFTGTDLFVIDTTGRLVNVAVGLAEHARIHLHVYQFDGVANVEEVVNADPSESSVTVIDLSRVGADDAGPEYGGGGVARLILSVLGSLLTRPEPIPAPSNALGFKDGTGGGQGGEERSAALSGILSSLGRNNNNSQAVLRPRIVLVNDAGLALSSILAAPTPLQALSSVQAFSTAQPPSSAFSSANESAEYMWREKSCVFFATPFLPPALIANEERMKRMAMWLQHASFIVMQPTTHATAHFIAEAVPFTAYARRKLVAAYRNGVTSRSCLIQWDTAGRRRGRGTGKMTLRFFTPLLSRTERNIGYDYIPWNNFVSGVLPLSSPPGTLGF